MPRVKLTFEQWLKEMDRTVVAVMGLSYQDLPDCPYRDWYDEGYTPKRAAKKAIKQANE